MPSLAQANKKSRCWVFTLNNYTQDDLERILSLPSTTTNVKYVCYGQEVGESGTPHLQGYIQFKNECRHSSVANLLQRAYVAIRQGSLAQAVAYCQKEGNFHEAGELRIPKKENKWSDIVDLAEQGKLDVIKDEYPLIYLMHKPKLESLMSPNLEPFQDDPKNHFEWWYGPTGTGKSRTVWEEYPEHYDKQMNKWWDGYLYDNTVVIEEADPKKCEHMAYFFKRWCDHYPFRAEIKNGHLNNIRPNKIIVTSNYTIKECFPNQQDWEPLMRRFKVVRFDSLTAHQQEPSEHDTPIAPGFQIPELFTPQTNEELQEMLMDIDC